MSGCSHYTVGTDTTRIDIEHNAGEVFGWLIPILDDNKQPVEIVAGTEDDWAAIAQVRRNAYSDTVLHEWSTTSGNTAIVPGPASAVRITATAEETTAWQDWPDYTCAWDLWLTEPGPNPPDPYRLAAGGFRLWPRITH